MDPEVGSSWKYLGKKTGLLFTHLEEEKKTKAIIANLNNRRFVECLGGSFRLQSTINKESLLAVLISVVI